MYKPTSGKIYVDGKENQTISLSAVFQENKLFNMSIIDNITFKSKVDEGKLNQIIKICRLEEVLEKDGENVQVANFALVKNYGTNGEKIKLSIEEQIEKESRKH